MDGSDIVTIAMQHLGERYVLGARAPLTNPGHRGPWDCAEFISWCAYQAYGIVFGCFGQNPATADPYSGKWYDDAVAADTLIPTEVAVATPGAFLVRRPGDFNIGIGHITISLGDGRSIEAHSSATGVVIWPGVASRHWTSGLHLPGVLYTPGVAQPVYTPPQGILRLANPYARGDAVRLVQLVLSRRGFVVSPINGIYDLATAAAVSNFQIDAGLVVDGEVGSDTATALGIGWPINEALLPSYLPPA